MPIPKLKAEECYDNLLDIIERNETLDLWTFRGVLADYDNNKSVLGRLVVGMAYIAKGQHDTGFEIIEQLQNTSDEIAQLYCKLLSKFVRLEQLDKCIYQLAERFPGKWFSYKAGGTAYLTGRLSLCSEFFGKHVKMLSEEEDREKAELFREEAIEDMDSAYKASGCSSEQYREIGYAVGRVIAAFSLATFKASISGAHGGSYIVELLNVTPSQVAQMNMMLADEICSIDLLDDCNLIARFSVERPDGKGATYAY